MTITITQIANVNTSRDCSREAFTAPDADYMFHSVRNYRAEETEQTNRELARRLAVMEARNRQLEAERRPAIERPRGGIHGLLTRLLSGKPQKPLLPAPEMLAIEDKSRLGSLGAR